MKKYHDNKSYNAIVEAMQQIRYNALVEEYGEDEMEEAYMYEEDDEEMAEMSDEEEMMVAEMMDEALYEMDMEDDEDNLTEADDGRKARRRKRLRQALLIGAGLAATGLGVGAGSKFVAQGKLPGGFGQGAAQAFRGAVGGSVDRLGRAVAGLAPETYRDARDAATQQAVKYGFKGRKFRDDAQSYRSGDGVEMGGKYITNPDAVAGAMAAGRRKISDLQSKEFARKNVGIGYGRANY